MAELLHVDAVRLWRSELRPDDRILILGATGWFGRTAAALTAEETPTMLVASRAREFSVGSRSFAAIGWDAQTIAAFAPTVLIDCAFLTRDLVATMALEEYVERNREVSARMLHSASLASVQRVITISSGAAVHPVDAMTVPLAENPYGRLKREAEESLAIVAAGREISAVVARAWSVSGSLVLKPTSYALSDMILQAARGSIHITASTQVYRRYVSVEDLLAVCLGNASEAGSRVIDSGGPLVEMEELAEAVSSVVNPAATITRSLMVQAPANTYYAAPGPWQAATANVGFTAADLRGQIATAAAGLL